MQNGVSLLNYNFKGGVGKTTLTGMEAYILARENKKILLIDFDPQANLTQMIGKTFNKKLVPRQSILNGLMRMDFSKSIVHASNNIDIVPSNWDLSLWPQKISRVSKNKRPLILKTILSSVKMNYDYIFIDVPPTLTEFVINAIFAADGISIVLQTQSMSYRSALLTVKELYTLQNEYHLNNVLLGVILYLFHNARVDRIVTKNSIKTFGKVLFANHIKTRERVKGFTLSGIRDKDYWDRQAIKMYYLLTKETEYRVRKMIVNG